jgi:hypothetical protein
MYTKQDNNTRNFSLDIGRALQPDGNKLQNFISKEMKKERQ